MANARGNETIHPSSSAARALPPNKMSWGTRGSSRKGKLGRRAGWLRWARRSRVQGGCQGFGNASLSPLCLIIWMTSLCMTQRHLYGRLSRLLEMTPRNDACHWSSKLTRGDGGMLKAGRRGRGRGRGWRRADVEGKEGKRCKRAERW